MAVADMRMLTVNTPAGIAWSSLGSGRSGSYATRITPASSASEVMMTISTST
jgi:hypothetical protein